MGCGLLGHFLWCSSLRRSLLVLTDLVVVVRDLVDEEGLALGLLSSGEVVWAWTVWIGSSLRRWKKGRGAFLQGLVWLDSLMRLDSFRNAAWQLTLLHVTRSMGHIVG